MSFIGNSLYINLVGVIRQLEEKTFVDVPSKDISRIWVASDDCHMTIAILSLLELSWPKVENQSLKYRVSVDPYTAPPKIYIDANKSEIDTIIDGEFMKMLQINLSTQSISLSQKWVCVRRDPSSDSYTLSREGSLAHTNFYLNILRETKVSNRWTDSHDKHFITGSRVDINNYGRYLNAFGQSYSSHVNLGLDHLLGHLPHRARGDSAEGALIKRSCGKPFLIRSVTESSPFAGDQRLIVERKVEEELPELEKLSVKES